MSPTKARLWGPLLRVGHWAAALAVLVAVLTAGRPLGLHSRAGYAVLAYVAVRAAWSAFGPARARLWSALGGPAAIFAEVRGVVMRQPDHPDGLGPFGALLVVALLGALTMAGITGIATLAVREGEGPLALMLGAFYEPPAQQTQIRQDFPPSDPEIGGTTIISRTDRVPSTTATGEHPDIRSGGALKSMHGFFSSLAVWLIVAHVLWVFVASLVRGENLMLSMVTGLSHVSPPAPPSLASVIKSTPRPAPDPSAEPSAGGQLLGTRESRKAAKAARLAARQSKGGRSGGREGGRRNREAG